jgi:hypothetical protein
MKKIVEIVVVAMALMALLCSCGDSNDDATSVISDEYKKLTSASELAEDAKQAIQKEYDTFSLNCTAPDESEFSDTYYRIDYDWNVWTEDECKKKMQDALSLENEDYQEKCLDIVKEDAGGDIGEVSACYYGSNTAIFAISPTAYCTYFIREPMVSLQTAGREQVGCYRINEGDSIEGISYSLSGEDYSLTDAVDYCDQYLASLQDVLGFESVELRKIYVYEITEDEDVLNAGDHMYFIFYSKKLEGVNLEFDCTTIWTPELPAFGEPYILIQMYAPNQVSQWRDNSTKHITSKEQTDGVLPLSYALDKVESEVAEYSNYSISSIELNYATLQWQWDSSTFYYEPYWCIRLESGVPKGGAANMDWDPCTMAYVNAVSGECYVTSDIAGSLIGMEQYFENPEWDPETNPEAQWRKIE